MELNELTFYLALVFLFSFIGLLAALASVKLD